MDATTTRATRFEEVADQVYEPLQRYLRRRAAPEDADEVLNDTLTVLWRRLDDVPVDDALPWSYRVAQHCLSNHRRGDRRRSRLVGRVIERGPVLAHVDEPSMVTSDDRLATALGALGSDDRELMRLWAWEQLEPREIAFVLDTTPNAVSLRLTRTKQRLRALLEESSENSSGERQSGGVVGQERVGHRKEQRS